MRVVAIHFISNFSNNLNNVYNIRCTNAFCVFQRPVNCACPLFAEEARFSRIENIKKCIQIIHEFDKLVKSLQIQSWILLSH